MGAALDKIGRHATILRGGDSRPRDDINLKVMYVFL
jgi:hypothetical protein